MKKKNNTKKTQIAVSGETLRLLRLVKAENGLSYDEIINEALKK